MFKIDENYAIDEYVINEVGTAGEAIVIIHPLQYDALRRTLGPATKYAEVIVINGALGRIFCVPSYNCNKKYIKLIKT